MRSTRCDVHGRVLVQVSLSLGGHWVCPDCLFTTTKSLAVEVNGQQARITSLKESLHAAREECHDLERRLDRLKAKAV